MNTRSSVFVSVFALIFSSPLIASAQSSAQLNAVRTFSPVQTGTTDVLDPLATTFDVTVTFTDTNTDPAGSFFITAFGFKENAMPPGWTYDGIVASLEGMPSGGSFVDGWFWVFAPPLPFSFKYRLNVDVPLTAPFTFDGVVSVADFGPVALYPSATQTLLVPSVPPPPPPPPTTSSADQNGDGVVQLTELLRVIQFFNMGTFHCDAAGEDGYNPGVGDISCAPHTSDYDPQDWNISLTEVLRLVQFFNMLGYYPCASGEDGFCPGAP